MQSILAIAWLTWKAAIRFRFFLVIAVLLLLAVVGLPIMIKDDGSARGFIQIFLTYTLSVITALLGLSTLWLACGTMARDIEENQMQVVAVKPVARWQIWMGKWLGLVTLTGVLLALSSGAVYGMLLWRADKLPEQQRHVLQNEVMVARGSARDGNHLTQIEAETDRRLNEQVKAGRTQGANMTEVRRQIREEVVAELQVVAPGDIHAWDIDMGSARNTLQDQPLYLRVKFNAAAKSQSGTFNAQWQIGDPRTPRVWHSEVMHLAPDTFYEFEVPANLVAADGRLIILFSNGNNTALLFPIVDGMEVLYRETSFGVNYLRGIGIIFCWMALLAALGLAAASIMSFPVATFFSLSILLVVLGSGTLSNAVADGTVFGYDEEASKFTRYPVDQIVIPLFSAMLNVINLAKDYSPIDSLSSGRIITGGVLLGAGIKIVLVLGGIIGGIGILLFNRRELATAQGNQ